MSIMSDKWIADKSINEKMIEPFSKNQVREDDKGNKIISYGNSSY
ncbi:MAG: dCTP deaminase, partial [Proteobacteria bacterium]|nr:dCTP deaminase [Pseudomonadota bacterium]